MVTKALPRRWRPRPVVLAALLLIAAPAAAQQIDPVAEAGAQPTVRIIVKLAAPWFRGEGPFRGNPFAVLRQRARIATAQAASMAGLAGTGYRVLRTYETSPFVALEATPEALAALARSPLVASVTRDFPLFLTLATSAPLVQAPEAHAAGLTGAGQDVIVIDTGIERDHPFFGGRVIDEFCLVSAPNDCPNG